ncbi:tetratricopeptide repeat protein (plasmid) [Streptomyces sp. NBC_01450]|uniref:AfsR/SARP family transcriptional regulator n=1 Tax=Streptomyces sp. NBC_01450 TaxID=2903871 RepID=UPI002E2FD61E|nr:BTAD domain-containing putative transcriptional regulator [Streptomyces sp. NBC_01450]
MDDQLTFSVLGPVSAWRGTEEAELGTPQQRTVLAVLLLAEGAQVSTAELVDILWGARPPASALSILRTYVHRLRKALDVRGDSTGSVIHSVGDGYQLNREAGELDLRTFRDRIAGAERTRQSGDANGTLRQLDDALRLWRGTALYGIRGEYARIQRRRIEELRLTAEAARIAARLELAPAVETVSDLHGLIRENPLDERFRELMMLALYRSGQQAAALDSYREVQALLAEELGVDPGPALQTMYQRVLRADPGLLPVPDRRAAQLDRADPAPKAHPAATPAFVRPAQLPAGLPVFVGREVQLAEVQKLSGGGTAVVSAVAGMAGVGKTAFAVHWARQVADRFPDGQLYLNLRGFDPAAAPVTPEHALRTLAEGLGFDGRALPQDVDALAARYRTLLAGKRMLVLLDNARDAAQVRPLLPGAPGCLTIVTSRDRLAGLVAVDGAFPVHLDVLSVAEARRLLARRLGSARVDAEPEAVDTIISLCARLPLALAVTAARAAMRAAFPLSAIADELREQAVGLDAFDDGDATTDVRAVFSWSYDALTPGAARLFRLLALHPGPDIALPAAAGLAGLGLPRTRRLISELLESHLVAETALGRYASHDLLRAYATELAESLEPPAELHAARQRMFDHYLHGAYQAFALLNLVRPLIDLEPPAEGAHAEEFGADVDRARAWVGTEWHVLTTVVGTAAAHHFDRHTWQLAWATSYHVYIRGRWRDLRALRVAGLAAARRLGDPAAEADALQGLAGALGGLGRFEEARTYVEQAIDLLGRADDQKSLADCHNTLVWVADRQGDLETALAASHSALRLCRAEERRRPGDVRARAGVASALNAVGWMLSRGGRDHEGLEHCRQALRIWTELGHDVFAANTWDSIGYAHHHLGEYDQAVAAFRDALYLFRRQHDNPWSIANTLNRLAEACWSAGRRDAARDAWTEALEIFERLGHKDAEVIRARLTDLDGSGSRGRPVREDKSPSADEELGNSA